jgi:hypothetical protein
LVVSLNAQSARRLRQNNKTPAMSASQALEDLRDPTTPQLHPPPSMATPVFWTMVLATTVVA